MSKIIKIYIIRLSTAKTYHESLHKVLLKRFWVKAGACLSDTYKKYGLRQGKNASGFRAVSTCVPRGEKLVARILKSGPLILKSEPLIFSLLRRVCNRLKNSSRLRSGECVFYYLFAVCRGAGVLLYTKRSSGFVKLRAYARRIALCPAEGVAGYDETVREGR